MNKRIETLSAEAQTLTPEERLELVERILASVAPSRPAIDAAWAAEAAERMAAYDRGEVETFDADEVLAELRAGKGSDR